MRLTKNECPECGNLTTVYVVDYGTYICLTCGYSGDLSPRKGNMQIQIVCKSCGHGDTYTHGETTCKQCGKPVGLKNDNDKVRWDLIQWPFIEEVAKVLTFGAKKYGTENWKNVERWRYVGAAFRHFTAYLGGEINDKETGLNHLAHLMCCVMFIFGLDYPVEPMTPEQYRAKHKSDTGTSVHPTIEFVPPNIPTTGTGGENGK